MTLTKTKRAMLRNKLGASKTHGLFSTADGLPYIATASGVAIGDMGACPPS